MNIEKITSAYIKIKNKREALAAAFKSEDDTLREKQDLLKLGMLEYCKENNIESVRTSDGTVYRSIKTKYWTNDWESIYEFVLEHGVPEFFQKSLNQSNVRQFLEENPDLRPKGLNIDSEYVVSVRKK